MKKTVQIDKYKIGLEKDSIFLNKVIASYPTLENTLPISKETVQAWIDAGTPGEGSVEVKENHNPLDYNDVCLSNKVDPQGNLLLEFAEEIYPVEEAILQALKENHLPIDDDFAEGNVTGAIFGAEWQKEQNKPSIPIDEEIERKAKTYAEIQHEIPTDMLNSIDQYDREHVMMIEQAIEDSKIDYLSGYKQALRDLGY